MPRGKQIQEKNSKKNSKKEDEEILTDEDDLLSEDDEEGLGEDDELNEEGELDEDDLESDEEDNDEEGLEEDDELDEEGELDEDEDVLESEEEEEMEEIKPKNKRGRPAQTKKENIKIQQQQTALKTTTTAKKDDMKQTKNNNIKVNSQEDKKRTSTNAVNAIPKETGSKKTSSNGTSVENVELTANKEGSQNKPNEKQMGVIEKEIQTTSKEIDQLKQNTHYQGGRLKKDPQQPIHTNQANKPMKHNLIFDTLMQQTETLMDYMTAQSEKIRQLNRKYIFLCSNGAFTKKEVNIFSNAIVYHEETLLRILYLAKKNLSKLEQLWQQKKTIMTDFSAKGAVDSGVGNKWIESLQASRKQIVKFQQTLEFYSKENTS